MAPFSNPARPVWVTNLDKAVYPPLFLALCHGSLILVHTYLAFFPYLPSLYSLIPWAKYFAICVDLQAWPLSTLPINLFISPSLYHQYLLRGPLWCLSSVPETSELCFQGQVAFYLTLTTLNAGLTQVKIFITSIMYALNLLLDQQPPPIPMFHILISILLVFHLLI